MDIKGAVTHKIGPLPVWAYVVIGAGLIFILRRRGGGSSDQQFVAANPAANWRAGSDPVTTADPPAATGTAPTDSSLAASIAALAAAIANMPKYDPTAQSPATAQSKASAGVQPPGQQVTLLDRDYTFATNKQGVAGSLPKGAVVEMVNGVPISLSSAGIAQGGIN